MQHVIGVGRLHLNHLLGAVCRGAGWHGSSGTVQSLMDSHVIASLVGSWGVVVQLEAEDKNFGMVQGRIFARLTKEAKESAEKQAVASKALLGQSPIENLNDMFGDPESDELQEPLVALFQQLVVTVGDTMPKVKDIFADVAEFLKLDNIKSWFLKDRITVPFVFAKAGIGGTARSDNLTQRCGGANATAANATGEGDGDATPAYLKLAGAESLQSLPTNEGRRRRRRALWRDGAHQDNNKGVDMLAAFEEHNHRYGRDVGTVKNCSTAEQEYSTVYKKCRPKWCAAMDAGTKDFYNISGFEGADYIGRLLDLVIDNTCAITLLPPSAPAAPNRCRTGPRALHSLCTHPAAARPLSPHYHTPLLPLTLGLRLF